jgi:hypothetical protein
LRSLDIRDEPHLAIEGATDSPNASLNKAIALNSNAATKIQFVVQGKSAAQKLVIIDPCNVTVDELTRLSMKTLNLKKKPLRIETKSGGKVIESNEQLLALDPGATLLFY